MPSTTSDRTAQERKPPVGLASVMLVEDDPVLALAIEDALLRAGAGKITICASVEETMRQLELDPRPDAIVLDVHLADRDDGWALAELVTLLGARPPRIVFSTGSPEDIPENVASLGPVFAKPYDPDELVASLLEGRKAGLFTLLRRSPR